MRKSTSSSKTITHIVIASAVALTSGCGSGDDTCDQAPPERVSYAAHIATFTKNYCTRCHATSLAGTARNGAPAAANFDTFAGISGFGKLANTRIQAGSMPLGTPKPTACDKQLFQAWIDQGLVER